MTTNDPNRYITLAIHTYDKAVALKEILEKAGVKAVLHNVNLSEPCVSSGVRIRIHEKDLPLALKIVEEPMDSLISKRAKVKILIPVDYSENSLKACKVGFDYAQLVNGRIIILHAFMNERRRFLLPYAGEEFENEEIDEEQIKALATSRMSQFNYTINNMIESGELPKVPFKTVVKEGIAEEVILEFAEKEHVTLIIMGSHGTNKKNRSTMGSVTAEVLDAGKFPIFTVPENITLKSSADIKHLVFFSNMIQKDVIAFDAVSRLLHKKGLKITVVPVIEKRNTFFAKNAEGQFEQYCKEHYPQYDIVMKRMNLDNDLEELQNYITKTHVDLIAIPNKKQSIFSRLFNPSIAHRVFFDSDTPMIVVPT
ncbi:MAG: universal stress protein [Muribaculaceae bacterium]|nr:universal stress protein [Muribaculaceae bacterium]